MPKPMLVPLDDGGEPPLRRGTYILLGIFLGWLGVHNFYAGHLARGAIQLLCGLMPGLMYVCMVIHAATPIEADPLSDRYLEESKTNTRMMLVLGSIMVVASAAVAIWVLIDILVTKKDNRGRWLR